MADLPRKFDTQVSLYLKGPDKTSLDITFELLAVTIVAEDGTEREVLNRPQHIKTSMVKGRQIFLGESILPDGKYQKLRFMVKEAFVTKKGRAADLALPPEGIEVAIDVTLRRNQNTTLFIHWNVDGSIQEEYLFSPKLSVRLQTPELSTLLVYVTNEDSNNVSVINRQSGDIAATVMVGRRPRGITTSNRGKRLKVYVANAGSNTISVIDPTTNKVENEIQIRFGREPEGIAVADLSSENDLIFVTNYGSDTVSTVDAVTYTELEKVDVGRGPISVAVDPPVRELIGTRFLSFDDVNVIRSYRERFFNVYVVNQISNDISVLRMDRETRRNVEVINLKVEWRPMALDIDYQRGKIYVANYDSDKVSVIDILKTIKGDTRGAVSTINNVGFSIIDVVAEPLFNRIYLLKEALGEIMIIRPLDEGVGSQKSVMPPIMGKISVGTAPRSFLLDPEGRFFYVVNSGADTVSVVDKTTKREVEVIPVGRRPYGVAVFPE